MCTKFKLGSLKGKDHSEDLNIDGRIILKRIIEKQGLGVCPGFIWFRIGTGGGEQGREFFD
jgi:hypothetical protein